MKQLTRKLFISVFTAVFALVALGTTTYAWFTMSTTANTDTFEGTITTLSGLDVAVTTIDEDSYPAQWYSGAMAANVIQTVINADAVVQSSGAKNKPDFTAVSAVAVTKNTLSMEKLDDTHKLGSGDDGTDAVRNVDYIAFKLWFRVSAMPAGQKAQVNVTSVELTNRTSIIPTWTADQVIKIAGSSEATSTVMGTQYTVDARSASRLFIGSYSSSLKSATFERAEVDAEGNNFGNEKGTQVNSETNVVTIKTNATGALQYFAKKQNAVPIQDSGLPTIYNTIKDLTDGTSTAANVSSWAVASDELVLGDITTAGNTSETSYITANVYFWIEGWDHECLSAVFAQTLAAKLSFEVKFVNLS